MTQYQGANALVMTARVLAVCALAGCAHGGPPPHPVAEMRARATAKLDLIELVVSDPVRAERARRLFQQLAELARQFDVARARSMLEARAAWQRRPIDGHVDRRAGDSELEKMLVPPIEEGRALFDRYTSLMLEAREVLSEGEFENLGGVR